ncbi:AAA family ATPase [Rhizobium leguminosarum]|uniref:AAA family ATPase n=1 Tax=Rhizobium leguminosarum TaxID=384 RepID=UPI001AE7AA7F|nr:AAA family ATPase [Rhizobium leguminosarum]MBP2443772.1 putative ATPase [Rhizobium leguminosarum]
MRGKFHILTGPNGAGKTSYLSWLADTTLAQIRDGHSDYRRVVCLSGTVHDRYSVGIWSTRTIASDDCVYLGYRTNNNAFSDISPFRSLALHFLYGKRPADRISKSLAAEFMVQLGFKPEMRVTSRRYNGRVQETYVFDFSRDDAPSVAGGFDSIAGCAIEFARDDRLLSVSHLSSGQKWYLLTILAACFCVHDGSLVVIDEPECSLHPEWQLEIMERYLSILEKRGVAHTTVISTHSPLVTSSVPNRRSVLCNLPADAMWRDTVFHGQTADTVLSSQFGVVSPRSPEVISLLQAGLHFLAKGEQGGDAFKEIVDRLRSFNLTLDKDDPLFDAFDTVLTIEGGL